MRSRVLLLRYSLLALALASHWPSAVFSMAQNFFCASMDTAKLLGRSARPMRGLRGVPARQILPPGLSEAAPPCSRSRSPLQHAMARWGQEEGGSPVQNNNRAARLCSGQDVAGCDPGTSQSPSWQRMSADGAPSLHAQLLPLKEEATHSLQSVLFKSLSS